MHIENIRFDEKINLQIEDFEKVKTTKVPKFSIQLLVENAIKHGFIGNNLNISITFVKESITRVVLC